MSTSVKSERIVQRCPGCGRLLRVPQKLKGMQVACKFCDQVMVVEPTPEAEDAPKVKAAPRVEAAPPVKAALPVETAPPVKVPPPVDAEHGLTLVGTGAAFQIQHTWSSARDKESHYTVIKQPSAQPLRGYTMAVECLGPSRVHMAGIKVADGQTASLGKVHPSESRLVPLDELHHAYLWLDKGASTTVKVIVARNS